MPASTEQSVIVRKSLIVLQEQNKRYIQSTPPLNLGSVLFKSWCARSMWCWISCMLQSTSALSSCSWCTTKHVFVISVAKMTLTLGACLLIVEIAQRGDTATIGALAKSPGKLLGKAWWRCPVSGAFAALVCVGSSSVPVKYRHVSCLNTIMRVYY